MSVTSVASCCEGLAGGGGFLGANGDSWRQLETVGGSVGSLLAAVGAPRFKKRNGDTLKGALAFIPWAGLPRRKAERKTSTAITTKSMGG